MVTVQDILLSAFTKAKITASGEVPTDKELQDALEEYRGLLEQWASAGMFGRLTDVLIASAVEAEPGQRVTLEAGGAATLPLGIDADGEDRPPYDLAFIEVIDRAAQTVERHLYEGGRWVPIHDLALSDPAPLAGRGRTGLAACLALLLADQFGSEVGVATMRQAAAFKTNLSLKMGGGADRTTPDYF